jgi:hypothetical protein
MAALVFTIFAVAIGWAPPAGSANSSTATSKPATSRQAEKTAASQPTSQPDDPLIASLIADLGSTDFRKRSAAQTRLSELGPTALPSLLRHINDPSPEIAERVQALVTPPADASMRVDLAVALLATRRPEVMERAVYMMFDMPDQCCELFLVKVPAMQGGDRIVGDAIAEQFRTWRGHNEAFLRNYKKILDRDAQAAARIKKMHTDGFAVHAEAAFQTALEALESTDSQGHAPETPLPTTRPVTKQPPAAPKDSQPR